MDKMGKGEWEVQDSSYSKSQGYKYSIALQQVQGSVVPSKLLNL